MLSEIEALVLARKTLNPDQERSLHAAELTQQFFNKDSIEVVGDPRRWIATLKSVPGAFEAHLKLWARSRAIQISSQRPI